MILGRFCEMDQIETLFESRWLKLQRIGHWDLVRRPHSDACVGILAITDQGEIILVEQFRIPVQKRVIEIPAGIVGDEPEHRGEPLEQTARRELLEETGYQAGRMDELIVSPTSAGMTPELIHLFYARDLVAVEEGGGVAGEDIVVHRVPLESLRDWLRQRADEGVAVDFKIHAALALASVAF